MSNRAPGRLLSEALERDPSRPLVTFYDDPTGERTELSVKTFDNWVAKTANFMVDGIGLAPGSRVALRLPLHWQTAVWLAAGWSVGVSLDIGGPVDPVVAADLLVCGPAITDPGYVATHEADEIVALSLRAWGAAFATPLPVGVTDYAAEVAGYGDRFVAGPHPDGGATEVDGIAMTDAGLLDAAAEVASRWRLETGGRLLTMCEPDTVHGLLALLPAALVVGGSVVLCRNLTDGDERASTLARRADAENVTAVVPEL